MPVSSAWPTRSKDSKPDGMGTLRAEGIRIVMLTGDGKATAQAAARKIEIDEVMAEVLPDRNSWSFNRTSSGDGRG